MVKNTGKSSQDDFIDIIQRLGKRAYLHRFVDASDVHGLTGKAANIAAQPSDFILVLDGHTEFAEVKSTVHETAFPFSMLRRTQCAAARQITSAGGGYVAYVKSLHLDRWFRIPYALIVDARTDGAGSLKWTQLGAYQWLA